MIGLGVAGAGLIAKEVLPYLKSWGFAPAAICGRPSSVEKTRETALQYAGGVYYCDFGEMLKNPQVEAVYIAVPNHLHFRFAREALLAGRDVICEKPLASNLREAEELARLAASRGRLLFEAVTTVYQPAYAKTREWLPRIGDIKLVSCHFCQYSSRYDAFRAGKTMPVFDPEQSGGALMDIGMYNLTWLTGLFGKPVSAVYFPNMERGIDTSGILTLDYGSFRAVSAAAKDCAAPARYLIQGTEGYLLTETTANICRDVTLHMNDGTEEKYESGFGSRMECEFQTFARLIGKGDREACRRLLQGSLLVSEVMTEARLAAGLRFPADA